MLFCRDEEEHYLCPDLKLVSMPSFGWLIILPYFYLFQVKPTIRRVEAWVLMPVRWWSLLLPRPRCLTKSGTLIASMRMTQSIFGREICLLTWDRTSTWWSKGRGSLRYCRALWVGLRGGGGGGGEQENVIFWDSRLTFWDLEIYVTAS